MEHIEHLSDAGPGTPVGHVAARLKTLRERIERACAKAARNSGDLAILAVTKGFGPEEIVSAVSAGLADIGENYYQEAAAKFAKVAWPSHPPRRHFIGHLQTNKARKIAALFDVVQTVDGAELADALEHAAAANDKPLDVCIQVNVTGDQRAGVRPEAARQLADRIASQPHLRLRGTMAVGPIDKNLIPAAFELARHTHAGVLSDHPEATLLSLGMSDDLEEAIAAGSTMLRVGSALFGARPRREG